MGKNEECSPLSSYEINVNMLNEVGFKKDQGSSELLTYVKKKKGSTETWLWLQTAGGGRVQ